MLNQGALSTRLQSPALREEGLRTDPQTQGSFEMYSPGLTNTDPQLRLSSETNCPPHPIARTGVGEGTARCSGILNPHST